MYKHQHGWTGFNALSQLSDTCVVVLGMEP